MRSKSLIAEIEAIYDERQEQLPDGAATAGPHLTLAFPVSRRRRWCDGLGPSPVLIAIGHI
jgi:hypothetical protein